jgi:CRISPR-associated protein Csx14
MAECSIPVDLFNPGQVFACLGFLEAADVLLGDAEGGFDWSDEADVRFLLRAAGEENPFAVVLQFLAEAEVHRCAPIGYKDPAPRKNASAEDNDEEEDSALAQDLRLSESFPNRQGDRMALPVRFECGERPPIDLGHWADGSSRNEFKLYAGNRTAHGIARAMLRGTRKKPGKKQSVGDVKTQGIAALWDQRHDHLTAKPFDVLTLMGGSFNFDPRGAWTAIDAGYSPNQHKEHGIAASPVVELLAAWGLEHARPEEYETRQVRYGVWSGLVPPILARPALAGVSVSVPVRRFQFELDLSGKNKVVTFAQEETNV